MAIANLTTTRWSLCRAPGLRRLSICVGDSREEGCSTLIPLKKPTDVLLESGINAWELLLPGFKQLLVENGGIPFTMGTEIQWFMFSGYLVR